MQLPMGAASPCPLVGKPTINSFSYQHDRKCWHNALPSPRNRPRVNPISGSRGLITQPSPPSPIKSAANNTRVRGNTRFDFDLFITRELTDLIQITDVDWDWNVGRIAVVQEV